MMVYGRGVSGRIESKKEGKKEKTRKKKKGRDEEGEEKMKELMSFRVRANVGDGESR